MNFDIVSVGSATADVFIKTKSKPTIFEVKKHEHDVCYPIGGKILIDDLHFETGGGGTNTAVSFSRLGFKAGYIGKLGNDMNSVIVLHQLKKENVHFLGNAGKGMTGYSIIIVGLEKDRTILAYKGINDNLLWKDIHFNFKTKWFYFSALLGESYKTFEKIVNYAKKNKIKYAFNPSSYIAKQGISKLKKVINDCDILILNKEEATILLKTKNENVNHLLRELKKYVAIIVITDGKNGAYAFDGKTKYTICPPKTKVVETTGAGDAFASGFVAGIIKKNNIEYAMKLGMANSQSILCCIGAKNNLLRKKDIDAAIKKQNKVHMERL